jgi:hypothetical protein
VQTVGDEKQEFLLFLCNKNYKTTKEKSLLLSIWIGDGMGWFRGGGGMSMSTDVDVSECE